MHELLGWSGPLTHRQANAWDYWLDEQWNKPSRIDHYLMQIAYMVQLGNAKNPKSVDFKDFKLKFESSKAASNLTAEQAAVYSKAKWFAFVGYHPNKKKEQKRGRNNRARAISRKDGSGHNRIPKIVDRRRKSDDQ